MLRGWLRPGGRLVFNAPRVRPGVQHALLPRGLMAGEPPAAPLAPSCCLQQTALYLVASRCAFEMWRNPRLAHAPCAATPAPPLHQGFASRAFSVFAQLLARRGLRVDDPSLLFEDEASVRDMLAAAGFASADISASEEAARRLGRAPADWAAAGWAQSRGLPFADLAAVLDEAAVEQLRLEYLTEAEALARQFATPEGDVVESFHMLWVVARAPE